MARILIVDDEKMICEEFRDVLQEDRHEVDIALNGAECLRKVREQNYDLVFLDVLMPVMEGRQVFEEIRKIRPVKVALISGYLSPNKEREAVELGAVACLRKPLELSRIRKLIRNLETKGSGEDRSEPA